MYRLPKILPGGEVIYVPLLQKKNVNKKVSNKGGRRKPLEVVDGFMALITVMVSKLINLHT